MHIGNVTKHRLNKYLPYLFIILMVISIIFFQITHRFFINGVDTFFHMSVAYDTARQLKTGNFSYFLSPFGFYHSLRIVNAVYGPLGGYFSGLLLLVCGTWIRWEIATFFITFTIAGISMYQLCRYWRVTRIYSVLIGGLYMMSFPVMSMWMNTQYDGLGAVFMPWVLYFGSKILNCDGFKNWKLIILLIILAELHVFSMLLGLLVLGMCYIASLLLNKSYRKLISVKAVKVLLLTLILSFNVWGGILEVLHSNLHQTVPTYSFTNMLKNIWGAIGYNHRASLSQNLFLLGLSTTVLLIITVGLYILMARYLNFQLNFIMVSLGLLFLWLSSRWFPWPLLQRHFPILDTDLQFPKRFLPVSLTALGLILGVILTKINRRTHNNHWVYGTLIIILGVFTFHAWHNTYLQSQFLYNEQLTANYYRQGLHHSTGDMWLIKSPHRLQDSLHSEVPGRYFRIVTKTTPDYMPTDQKILNNAQYHKIKAYSKYLNQVVKNKLRYHYAYNHHVMMISFRCKSAKRITVPFVKYSHTQSTLNGQQLRHPSRTAIGALNIKPRTGKNVMTFSYQPNKWYLMFMWISILAWLWFIYRIVRIYRGRFNFSK